MCAATICVVGGGCEKSERLFSDIHTHTHAHTMRTHNQ